jgi:hypothetical protein
VFVVGSTIDSNGEAGIILQGREGARHCLVADCVITGNPIPIVERHGSRDNYRTRNQTVGATGMS